MLSGFSRILADTAASIEKTVQSTVHEVTGPKAIAEYDIGEQIGSGGPGMLWRLYRATPKSKAQQTVTAEVCVWILDKKELAEERQRRGSSKAAEDALLDIFRAESKLLMKLRHPGVIRVVEPLDESKQIMAMVTEPLLSSVANAMGNFENMVIVPRELEVLSLSQLEIKHGLMQLAETLSFVHNNARLVHRGVAPDSVYITTTGGWKLAGFGFSILSSDVPFSYDEPPFHYPDYDFDGPVLPLQPQLDYTAPELTRRQNLSSLGGGASGPGATGDKWKCLSDVFSLALLTYHLINRKPLLQCRNNLRTYHGEIQGLPRRSFVGIPMELERELRRMLLLEPSNRPSASEFTGAQYFTEDLSLKALRFLDQMIGRDNAQRIEFLNSLQNIWAGFDSRVLRYKVLPPLMAELKNTATQQLALPFILKIADTQDSHEFGVLTQASLLPITKIAGGETLLLFLKHMPNLVAKVNREVLEAYLLPMIVRAYEDPDPRIQEETLKGSASLTSKLDFGVVRETVLPRVHMLALRTSVAEVRAHALLCLGDMISSLDKSNVMDILQTCARCAAVDHSAPTLMCVLAAADACYRKYGFEFAAEHILPLLTPLLTAQQLSGPQFAKFLKTVMDILNEIQAKRGVSLSDADAISLDFKAMGLGALFEKAGEREGGDGGGGILGGMGSGAGGEKPASWQDSLDEWGAAKSSKPPPPSTNQNTANSSLFSNPPSAPPPSYSPSSSHFDPFAPMSSTISAPPSSSSSSFASPSSSASPFSASLVDDWSVPASANQMPASSPPSSLFDSPAYAPPSLGSLGGPTSTASPGSGFGMGLASGSGAVMKSSVVMSQNFSVDFGSVQSSQSGGSALGSGVASKPIPGAGGGLLPDKVEDDPFADWPPANKAKTDFKTGASSVAVGAPVSHLSPAQPNLDDFFGPKPSVGVYGSGIATSGGFGIGLQPPPPSGRPVGQMGMGQMGMGSQAGISFPPPPSQPGQFATGVTYAGGNVALTGGYTPPSLNSGGGTTGKANIVLDLL